MPSIDVDVSNVPDIIEAQLTLSYSRLTDLIRVIIDQGNGHEDDIDELRDRLAKIVQENGKLRSELDALKQSQGPGAELAATLDHLKNTVQQLSDKVEANTSQLAAVTAAQAALAESVEKKAAAQQAKMEAAMSEHAGAVDRRMAASESSMKVAQAFTDLWGAVPEQVLEMGRRNASQEVEHSLKDRTTFLLSMPAFVKMREELDVLRSLMQRQAADALAAKTSEVARTSRTASLVAPQVDAKDHSDEIDALAKTVRTLELQMQVVQQQRLPPLEAALTELQGYGAADDRVSGVEKDVNRLYDQLALLEERLNTLLGLSGEKNAAEAVAAANPALVDLARRVSTLEGTVDGVARGSGNSTLNHPSSTPTTDAAGSGTGSGEVVSADGNGRPSSSRGPQGRPPSGRPGSGLLPALNKELQSSSNGTATTHVSPPPRRSSSLLLRRQSNSDPAQPTVEVLRQQEASQPSAAPNGRRISVAVEPDDGLRRRVVQLEENAAILEVNKADRRELQQLEAALRQALGNMGRPHSGGAQSSPALVPQRPMSAGGRFVHNQASSPVAEVAQGQRGSAFSRPASASGALGRPMFVGSTSSVYLRDGAQLTNATVSPTGENRL